MTSASRGRVRTIERVSGMTELTTRTSVSRTWGHRDRDLALGGLDAAGTRPVARAPGVGRPRVAGAPEEDRDLVLDGALEDELRSEAAEGAQSIGAVDPIEQDRLDGFLDLDAGGYPSFHGVVSSATC